MTLSTGPNSLTSEHERSSGVVTEIQRYSIKDGPGIRTTVFMKGCHLRCEWCANPEAISPHPELFLNDRLCSHCGDCVPVCPTHAFSMVEGTLVFDRSLCDACGECVSACPEEALEIMGLEMAAEDVTAEVLSDAVFYQVSGGGVTFSGGEPLLQSGFIRDVARDLKEQNIHVAIDTAGNVPWHAFAQVLPFTDLFLYDIKFFSASAHKRYTGVDNRLILANARKMAEHGIPLIVRLVVVPGINDSPQEFQGRLNFVGSLETVTQVDLLPYHKLGMAKYVRLGKGYALDELEIPDEARMETLRQLVSGQGFEVTVGG